MEGLLQTLESLNRKERFFLLGHALGNPTFRLSESFLTSLSYEVGIEVPPDARCWMDYHLDWVYAALEIAKTGSEGPHPSPAFLVAPEGAPDYRAKTSKEPYNINTNQEDCDLLVAFDSSGVTYLIFVEAKGVTDFGNRQLHSKARRLRRIFGKEGDSYEEVLPYFVLASPSKPAIATKSSKGLSIDELPSWMLRRREFYWVNLPLPRVRRVLERIDSNGSPSSKGQYWSAKKSENLKKLVAERSEAESDSDSQI